MGRYSESLGLDWQISDVGTALDETLHVARDKKSTKGTRLFLLGFVPTLLIKVPFFSTPKVPEAIP